jgi:hypothetical protein
MQNPDDFNELFSRMRATPPPVDPALVSRGFETRVLARVRATRAPEAATWFWRWSIVFSLATAACLTLVVQNYNDLTDASLAALDGGTMLLGWLL